MVGLNMLLPQLRRYQSNSVGMVSSSCFTPNNKNKHMNKQKGLVWNIYKACKDSSPDSSLITDVLKTRREQKACAMSLVFSRSGLFTVASGEEEAAAQCFLSSFYCRRLCTPPGQRLYRQTDGQTARCMHMKQHVNALNYRSHCVSPLTVM